MAMGGMRFGLTAFCTAESLDPATLARRVEELGFDVLLFPDHTHVPVARRTPYPGGGDLPEQYRRTFDPLAATAWAMNATERLRVGIGVCVVPAREPIALAKALASLDVLSGGRLVVGVGAGWNLDELADHGVEPEQRWAILRERVLAMKAIWTQDEAAFEGRFVRFDPLWSWPKPVQTPHPPIVVGGHGPGVLQRVVDYGDEWLVMVAPGQSPLRDRLRRLQDLAAAAGRGPIPVSVQVYGDPPDPKIIERYLDLGVARIDFGLPHGPPAEGLAALDRLGALVARYG